ncbi:hypothetical protein [Deinococcus sp.]|uniref:hypothetical protein n=1 Tax=Deinococcus sp. TaxID=47478 RepID=UPI0025E5BE77|nr:hypothetical protein [Deinococcus sp.]
MSDSSMPPLEQSEFSAVVPLRPATQADIDRVKADLPPGTQALYLLESGPDSWRVADGDVTIDASILSTEYVIVFGNLTINGNYDDNSGDGALVVMESLSLEHCTSWGTVYVHAGMTASGLVYAYYNDHTFEVDGKTNARGVLFFDKAGHINPGVVGFYLNDFDDHDQYGDHLLTLHPDLFVFGDYIEESTKMHNLFPDFGLVRKRLQQGLPIFRAVPAPRELLVDIEIAIDYSSSDNQILAILGGDVLLPRLVAARDELSDTMRTELRTSADPVVQRLLAAAESP